MAYGDDRPIGRRVAYWRGRRGWNQQQLADALGKSKSWVDKVERGVRDLNKVDVLNDLAATLRIDVARLTGVVSASVNPAGAVRVGPAVADIGSVLARYDVPLTPGARQRIWSPVDLGKAVEHSWLSLHYGHYDRLLRDLPRLLAEAQRYRAVHRDPAAARLLGQAYQVAATVLRKIGEHHLAWLAADRGMAVSADADDPLLAARAAVPLGGVVGDVGLPRRAVETCLAIAHGMAPADPLDAGPEHLSVYGCLLLQAAMGAAHDGDERCADDLLEQAAEAAGRVGDGHDHYWTAFGPGLVGVARVAADVELGRAEVAVAGHQEMTSQPGYQQLPPGHRADHQVDAARGYAHVGDLTAAGRALLEADRIAPAEVRVRPVAREVLRTLLL
ncbi:XRE family transcriptional regulator, partial [Micromonospora fluostatini]